MPNYYAVLLPPPAARPIWALQVGDLYSLRVVPVVQPKYPNGGLVFFNPPVPGDKSASRHVVMGHRIAKDLGFSRRSSELAFKIRQVITPQLRYEIKIRISARQVTVNPDEKQVHRDYFYLGAGEIDDRFDGSGPLHNPNGPTVYEFFPKHGHATSCRPW
jgi:hypothetical protein